MKKTFKEFLLEANISDLEVFKNNENDPNRPVYDRIVKQQLDMEALYDQHLETDVERVLNASHQQYKTFRAIWNAMVLSKREKTLNSFLHSLHSNYDFVRKLAEVHSKCKALDRKTDGVFFDFIEEHRPPVAKMITMYDLIAKYRERYI